MEKMTRKNLVFSFVFGSFLIIFFLTSYFRTVDLPAFQSVVDAICIPLEGLGEATQPPINRFLESLESIFSFADGSTIPTVNDLLGLFISPFAMIARVLEAVIDVITGILDILI